VEFSSGGEVLYVAHSGQTGYVSMVRRYDGATLDVWELPAGQNPQSLKPLRGGQVLLVTHGGVTEFSSEARITLLSALDLTELAQLKTCDGTADGMAVMSTGERAFVRCSDATVSVIDLELRRIVRMVDLDHPLDTDSPSRESRCGPGEIALSRTDGLLIVPCSKSGFLVLLDRLTMERFDSMLVAPGIYHVAASQLRPEALVASRDRAQLSFVNLRKRSVETTVSLPGPATAIAVSGNGEYSLVVTRNGHEGSLVQLSMGIREVRASTPAEGIGAVSMWPGRWSPALLWR
jgi:hypothetical protein